MICSKCGTEDLSKFYTSGEKRRERNLCKDCSKLFIKERRAFLKIKAVEKMGGQCCRCGYDKSMGALEFHHLDSDKKEATISTLIKGSQCWNKLQKELDKCILLCANCHREEHCKDGLTQVDFKFDHEELLNERKRRWEIYNSEYSCKQCKNKFTSKRKKLFCSDECFRLYNRKVKVRPSNGELSVLLESESFVNVGKRFGVSDNTIRNWLTS